MIAMDLKGLRFGRLSVIDRSHDYVYPSGRYSLMWRCRCDCGKETIVRTQCLRAGETKSCGCFQQEQRSAGAKAIKHGASTGGVVTPEYRIWLAMSERCSNPRHDSYKWYGARGITVCERWKEFANFLSDVGPRPSQDRSIDRINNDGNYEPGNVRWASKREQAANRRPKTRQNHC